jgi:hypothetical protein
MAARGAAVCVAAADAAAVRAQCELAGELVRPLADGEVVRRASRGP